MHNYIKYKWTMGWKQYHLIHFFDLDAISLFIYLFIFGYAGS